MISYSEALELILKKGKEKKLSTELLNIEEASGRVLAQDLYAPHDLPSFPNSSMDGFAVQAKDTQGASKENPLSFEVLGLLKAEKQEASSLSDCHHKAFEIMTGAPIPNEHFDAVVKVEDVERVNNGFRLFKPLSKGENLRFAGEDFKKGKLIAKKGRVVRPELIMGLAALGLSKITVFKKIKVALLSTGSELVSYEQEKLERGMIRNATTPYLISAFNDLAVETKAYQLKEESQKAFLSLLKEVLESQPDMIVSTGAVSMGQFDFIPEALKEIKAKVLFHKVAIKPGKPFLFAELSKDGPLFFGLPGNPISSAVGLSFFLRPYLFSLRDQELIKPLKAKLSHSLVRNENLRVFYRALLSEDGQSVSLVSGQASFMISSFLEANAWLVLSEEAKELNEGDLVDVYRFKE